MDDFHGAKGALFLGGQLLVTLRDDFDWIPWPGCWDFVGGLREPGETPREWGRPIAMDPAVTARYLHPNTQAMLDEGTAFSTWWSLVGPEQPELSVIQVGRDARQERLRPGVLVGASSVGLTGFEPATP